MKLNRREFGGLSMAAFTAFSAHGKAPATKPVIKKLGTIDCDLVETTPIVFKGKVYRFEYVRVKYAGNTTGDSYFRLVDHASGKPGPAFAKGLHLGSAFVDGDKIIVSGVNIWDGEEVHLFVSKDGENWDTWNALNLPGYGIFNTSMCKAEGRYVLMFEVGRPAEVAGNRFTARFATSTDLRTWTLTAPECTYSKDRYTAPHALRYFDGHYYNFFLEAVSGGYEQYVVRSKDLIHWESSPLNPVIQADGDDKKIANPKLSAAAQEKIRGAKNINNSDFDYCEFEGKLIINYSWGDQHGTEFLAEAVYNGTEAEFLRGWFPKD